MTPFTKIPKQVEEVLEEVMDKFNGTASRRNFLKGSGLLVVSLSTAAMVPDATPLEAWPAGPARFSGAATVPRPWPWPTA